jgi:Ca-activated chloride channel family protein
VIAGALVLVLVAGGTATALVLNGQGSPDEAGGAT